MSIVSYELSQKVLEHGKDQDYITRGMIFLSAVTQAEERLKDVQKSIEELNRYKHENTPAAYPTTWTLVEKQLAGLLREEKRQNVIIEANYQGLVEYAAEIDAGTVKPGIRERL